MLSSDLLEMLRCPLDPTHAARQEEVESHLVCVRCSLQFPIRHEIPCMLIDEAKLPAGVAAMADLPCQREMKQQAAAT